MKSILSILFAVCLGPSVALHAQSERVASASWSTVNLNAPVNSPYHDAFPTVSSDGLVLYFASDRHAYDGDEEELNPWSSTDFDIYVARRPSPDAPWQEPTRLGPEINTAGEDHSITLSPDGRWMYFSSDRPDGCGDLDIYVAYRDDPNDDLGWGEPANLGCEINSAGHDACAIYHVDQGDGTVTLYFVSNRSGGPGSFDVYASRLNGPPHDFRRPVLVEGVSSPAFDGHLDPDAGFVWTMREGGLGGSDIWHTVKDDRGGWSPPVNAGPQINSPYEEQMPSPLEDGRILYFPSDRPGGLGGLDLYESRRRSP